MRHPAVDVVAGDLDALRAVPSKGALLESRECSEKPRRPVDQSPMARWLQVARDA